MPADAPKRFGLLKQVMRPYQRYFILGPAFKVIEVIFEIITPLVVASLIDSAAAHAATPVLLQHVAALAGMALCGYASTLVCQKMAAIASQGCGTELRKRLFAKVNELSAAEVDRFGTGSLVTRLMNDINQVQLALALLIRMVIRWPVLAALSIVAALFIDPGLGVVSLVCMPIVGLVFWWVMSRSIPYFRSMQAKLDRITTITREGLSGARVVRAFVQERHEEKRFAQASAEQAEIAVASGKLSALLNPVALLVMDLGIAALLLRGGSRIDAGTLTQGQLIALVNYMTQVAVSVGFIANLVSNFTRAATSMKRIEGVMDCEPSVTFPQDGVSEPNAEAPVLALRGVSFSYGRSASPALQGISLELAAGETLGIIGGTGSGKSTLVQLLVRAYDPQQGSVELYGEPLPTWAAAPFKRFVSLVPQTVSLMSGTVRSNIGLRNESASDSELWQALDCAQASDFVHELGDGLDAPVERDGRNFSGGQRQRLTIARALVGSPRVLILDDASSALDLATDARLRAAIAGLDGLDAAVIVSQRVSSVRSASKILVLDHGQQAGLGTHDELLRDCALYREICASQHVEEVA